MAHTTDVLVENHGTLFVFRLESPVAVQWWADNVATPPSSFNVVEHRYAGAIARGLLAAGMVLL